MTRLKPILLLLMLAACSGKDFWVQGPGTVTITTPIGSMTVQLEDGAIYSSTTPQPPAKTPEPEEDQPKSNGDGS